jgi:hypothetical protein
MMASLETRGLAIRFGGQIVTDHVSSAPRVGQCWLRVRTSALERA